MIDCYLVKLNFNIFDLIRYLFNFIVYCNILPTIVELLPLLELIWGAWLRIKIVIDEEYIVSNTSNKDDILNATEYIPMFVIFPSIILIPQFSSPT